MNNDKMNDTRVEIIPIGAEPHGMPVTVFCTPPGKSTGDRVTGDSDTSYSGWIWIDDKGLHLEPCQDEGQDIEANRKRDI
jgi:hypothetical protein